MNEKERDQEEFEEEWKKSHAYSQYPTLQNLIAKRNALQWWMASRRLMREQMGRWHDTREFYKEEKEGIEFLISSDVLCTGEKKCDTCEKFYKLVEKEEK
jgi:hypothetical protein